MQPALPCFLFQVLSAGKPQSINMRQGLGFRPILKSIIIIIIYRSQVFMRSGISREQNLWLCDQAIVTCRRGRLLKGNGSKNSTTVASRRREPELPHLPMGLRCRSESLGGPSVLNTMKEIPLSWKKASFLSDRKMCPTLSTFAPIAKTVERAELENRLRPTQKNHVVQNR